MIDLFDYCVDKIYEYAPGRKVRRQNKLNFRCPFCMDSKKSKTKKRGWLYRNNDDKPSFHCFNCSTTLGVYKFLAELEHKDISEIKRDLASEYMKISKEDLHTHIISENDNNITVKINETNTMTPTLKLGNTWDKLSKSQTSVMLVNRRQINKAPFKPKNWKMYYDTKYDRLIIPWYRNTDLKYYQSRTLTDKGVKYIFPKNTQKDIFGLDELDPSFPFIFLLEGVFDSIFVKNGICIGGLLMTDHQKDIIDSYTPFYELIYLTDNPWVDKTAAYNITAIVKNDQRIRFFEWDKNNKNKDINDDVIHDKNYNKYGDEEYLKSRITSGLKLNAKLKFLR